jgi:hypothetical protein
MVEARQLILGVIKIINWTDPWPDTKFAICALRFAILDGDKTNRNVGLRMISNPKSKIQNARRAVGE